MSKTDAAVALEQHYTVAQIAKLWGWSRSKVREVFRTEPGVLQSQLRLPGESQQITLTIPESVLLRVSCRLRLGS